MKKKPPKEKAEIAQEVLERAPEGWAEVQERVAAGAGLSVLLVDGYQPPALVASNNNSICHAFQSSPEFVRLCDPYCGQAHQRARKAGGAIDYKCHAGLSCIAMPIAVGDEPNLAVIGGRAFVSGIDYRTTVERFRAGDLKELLSKDPFRNVIFSDPAKLEELAGRLAQAARKFTETGIKEAEPAVVVAPRQKSLDTSLSRPEPERLNARALELQLEIEKLRGELDQRSQFDESLQHFLDRINGIDPEQTYAAILKNSKELLLAERASLFAFEESSNELIAKGVIGFPIEISEIAHVRVGEEIAGQVMDSGVALVVADLERSGFRSGPPERGYKTKSFISYPLIIAGRKIGVLNVADKIGGAPYDDVDLSLIDIIGPQIATALERAGWQERASEFRLMSVTDAGTGLLNRRYLEERLNEELNRSRRYNYPMSFLMIDIDDFKNYNDVNGHPAGDQALKITAHGLKSELRLEDVACRYGGEEFCILLPQTPINEAAAIAERIRRKIEDTPYPYGKNQPGGMVTISIGVSTLSRHVDTSAAVIEAADRALYSAKGKGKNRIEFYQETLGSSSDSIPLPDERQ